MLRKCTADAKLHNSTRETEETVAFLYRRLRMFTLNTTQGLSDLMHAAIAVHPNMKLCYSWCLQIHVDSLVRPPSTKQALMEISVIIFVVELSERQKLNQS